MRSCSSFGSAVVRAGEAAARLFCGVVTVLLLVALAVAAAVVIAAAGTVVRARAAVPPAIPR